MAQSDYYELLGLDGRNPTDEELRKAYKQAALRHHPDKNPDDRESAEELFKRIGEAYDTLSDPRKKHIYDAQGEDGAQRARQQDMYKQTRRARSGWDDVACGHRSSRRQGRGTSFRTSTSSSSTKFSFTINGEEVSGSGGDGANFTKTTTSNGGVKVTFSSGKSRSKASSRAVEKPDEVRSELKCTLEELYSGTTKSIKVTKELLDGSKSPRVLPIELQRGWREGMSLRLRGQGDERPGKAAQDLVFCIREKPHDRFKRKGDNLRHVAALSMEEASQGASVTVQTLDQRILTVDLPPGVLDHSSTTVEGEGMPRPNGGFGDLNLEVRLLPGQRGE